MTLTRHWSAVYITWLSLVALPGKESASIAVRPLAQEDPLDKEMETHSSILA